MNMAFIAALAQLLFTLFVTVLLIVATCVAFNTWNWPVVILVFSILWPVMSDMMEAWIKDWASWP
jgi:hypothetical protein